MKKHFLEKIILMRIIPKIRLILVKKVKIEKEIKKGKEKGVKEASTEPRLCFMESNGVKRITKELAISIR